MLSDSIFDPGKYPNQKVYKSESAGFLVWVFLEVQNWFWKQFLIKFYIITILNFLLSVSSKKNCIKKMEFPLYFQNVIWPA